MKILQITSHFSPNMGGVETHLDDLVNALIKRVNEVFVLTYRPLVTKTSWIIFENRKGVKILRIPWVPGLFYFFVNKPLFEFLYLLPGLFLLTPIILLTRKPNVIHGHGLVAGFVAVFWGNIFRVRSIISLHSIYQFPIKGRYRNFVKWLFENTDFVLGLSNQSVQEIYEIVPYKNNVGKFTYWIDLQKFKKVSLAKEKLGWKGNFIVLFVGRLIKEKGINELLESVKLWNREISLAIAGSGDLEEKVKRESFNNKQIIFLGKIKNKDLPPYYSAADLLIVPSVHEEGFGRVILESLACGTPVIGSNRGAIPEAMNSSVGRLINVTPENIKIAVEHLYKNKKELEQISQNARKFAERRYSEKNVEIIMKAYK